MPFDGGVFVGDPAGEIRRLDWPKLETIWRIPADGFFLDGTTGNALLMWSNDLRYRAVRYTGEVAWTLEPREGSTPWLRWDNRLYCNNPGVIVADVATGEVIEHHDVSGGPIRGGGLVVPGLYTYSTEEQPDLLRIYDLSARRIVWERNVRAEVRSAYGVTDPYVGILAGPTRDDVFVAKSERHFFGLSRKDGRLLWHRALLVQGGAFAMHEGRIYAWASVQGDPRGDRLVCLDEGTGEIVYDILLKGYGGDVATSYLPARGWIASGHIAFSTRPGVLAVFRLSDGELVWSYKYKTQVYEPVIAGHRLLVTASDGNLLVFEGKS